MNIKLYPWQEECMDAWFENHCHGIVNVVTGAGKTIMALAAMKKLDSGLPVPLRVKIVVPKVFMVSQWAASMLNQQSFLDISRHEIGYYYGSHKDSTDRKYMIYVIDSARYSLSRHIMEDIRDGYPVLIIADECHHYASRENRKIFDFLPYIKDQPGRYFSLGLSATPKVFNHDAVLIPALGPEIYQYGFGEAIRQNTIRNFALFHVALSFSADEADEYEDMSEKLTIALGRVKTACPYLGKLERSHFFAALDSVAKDSNNPAASYAQTVLLLSYRRKDLVYSAGARISCACNLVQNLHRHSKIIIFGERISQADILFNRLNEAYPNQVGRYHSEMEAQAQKNTITRYRNGEIRILVCCRALDEGFDIPKTHVGIVLSSASIERQRIQRLGRILRRTGSKDMASLYYLYIENSSEQTIFFAKEIENSKSLYLSYSAETDTLSHPAYEERAERLLQHFRQQGLDHAALSETEKCLAKGMILPDWLAGAAACKEKIHHAETTEIRNYWICMLRMIREAEE